MNNLGLDKSSSKYKIISYIFISLPVLLITGPFLPDLGISLISLLFIHLCIKNKNFSYFNNIYFKVFFLFYLYIVFNSLFNNFSLTSLKISFFYFRFGIFAIAVWFILEVNKNVLNKFYIFLTLAIISLVVDGYFQYFFERNIFGNPIIKARISSFFGDELILGSYLSRLFPILFGIFILNFSKIKQRNLILIYLLFISIEVLIFLSGERTAFFYLNLSTIFCLIFLKNFKKIRFIILGISFLIILIIINFDEISKKRMISKTANEMNLIHSNNIKDLVIFSPKHQSHYLTALNMFKDKPIIGVGVKKFEIYCDEKKFAHSSDACSTHPHNSYIQLLAETGVIGFSYLCLILLYFIFYSFRHILYKFQGKNYFNDFEIFLLSAILITIWPIAPNGNFFNNWLNIIYYLPVGLFLWSKKKNKILTNN